MHLESRSCITCHAAYCESHKQLFGNRYESLSANEIEKDPRIYDFDMVWVPWFETWVCVKCFDIYYKGMTLEEYIEGMEDILVTQDENGSYERYLRKKYQKSFLKK